MYSDSRACTTPFYELLHTTCVNCDAHTHMRCAHNCLNSVLLPIPTLLLQTFLIFLTFACTPENNPMTWVVTHFHVQTLLHKVFSLHSFYFLLCSSSLLIEPGSISQEVLDSASQMLKSDHNFAHTTLQVEDYQEDMEACKGCKDTPSKRRRSLKDLWTMKNRPTAIWTSICIIHNCNNWTVIYTDSFWVCKHLYAKVLKCSVIIIIL